MRGLGMVGVRRRIVRELGHGAGVAGTGVRGWVSTMTM